LIGISGFIGSITYTYSILLSAALGPTDSTRLIEPLIICFISTLIIFYAYYKTSFPKKWIKILIFLIFILPLGTIGIFSGIQAGYIAVSPVFEKAVIIERNIEIKNGWHFINSNSYFPIANSGLYDCIREQNSKKIIATLEVTLHYGRVSYFRVLKFGSCDVQHPHRNPNAIVPAYVTGEESNSET
jgi:hypothetical protein